MYKLLLLLILATLVTSQSEKVKEVIKEMQGGSLFADNGYTSLPINNLDQSHSFIKDILEYTFPALLRWQLVDIK